MSRYRHFPDVKNTTTNTDFKGNSEKNLFDLVTTDEDIFYTIPLEFEYRPDLICNKFYGRSDVSWALIYANRFSKSPQDFESGITIRIPNIRRVMEIL